MKPPTPAQRELFERSVSIRRDGAIEHERWISRIDIHGKAALDDKEVNRLIDFIDGNTNEE